MSLCPLKVIYYFDWTWVCKAETNWQSVFNPVVRSSCVCDKINISMVKTRVRRKCVTEKKINSDKYQVESENLDLVVLQKTSTCLSRSGISPIISQPLWRRTPEVKLTNVAPASNSLLKLDTWRGIKLHTQEKVLTNVLCAPRGSDRETALRSILLYTQEINLTSVTSALKMPHPARVRI